MFNEEVAIKSYQINGSRVSVEKKGNDKKNLQ